jgi:hypothetical protein
MICLYKCKNEKVGLKRRHYTSIEKYEIAEREDRFDPLQHTSTERNVSVCNLAQRNGEELGLRESM